MNHRRRMESEGVSAENEGIALFYNECTVEEIGIVKIGALRDNGA